MAPDDGPAGPERVNAFTVGERYLFRHYFTDERVFARLRRYYDHQGYRFAVPADEFDEVQGYLGDRGVLLTVVEDQRPFVVVVRKYTAHPDGIFKDSVLQRSVGDHNCFLLKDEDAVESAVAAGATRLGDTDLDWPVEIRVGRGDDEDSPGGDG